MANVIKIKGKVTTGAPALADLEIREFCINIPDETLYLKKDGATLLSWPTGAGVGDMLKATYDPNAVNGDVFDMASMTESATEKIFTDTERAALTAVVIAAGLNTNKDGITAQQTADITANNAKPDSAAITAEIDAAKAVILGGTPSAVYDTLTEIANELTSDNGAMVTLLADVATKLNGDSTIDGGTI